MKYQKPKGTRDLYGDELRRVEAITTAARTFYRQHGYDEIQTPVFEFTQLFDRSIGERTDIVEHEMYKFEINKKWYALRPEGTASVLRAVIENNIPLPARLFYIWHMYRRERPQKGRYREFLQIGIELLGEGAPFYDAEIIDQGKRFLDGVGARDITIEVNSIGCLKCRSLYKEKLKAYLTPSFDKLCADCQRRFKINFLRIFDCKKQGCQKILHDAPKISDHLCQECLQHYVQVKNYLDTFGIGYIENKTLVRGLDYYTRTVFEFKQKLLGAQDTILAGGRYDLLMKELGGIDSPCTGWAMGVDRLLLAMPPDVPPIEHPKVFYIAVIGETYAPELIGLRSALQKQHVVCLLGNPEESIKRQLKTAHRLHADYVIIYGEDEERDNVYTVRDMRLGEQKKIAKNTLSSFLANCS
jgi:histidyl-tRNA synthetase